MLCLMRKEALDCKLPSTSVEGSLGSLFCHEDGTPIGEGLSIVTLRPSAKVGMKEERPSVYDTPLSPSG
jgi:hypothetical protein